MAVACLLIYGQTAGYPFFTTDDHHYIYENYRILNGVTFDGILQAFTEPYFGNWHPLTTLSWMFEISLFGVDPGVMHITNSVIHMLASLSMYLLAWMLLQDVRGALLAALLFAVHPLHAESVAWISERKDVLCGLFYLTAAAAYLRYGRQPSLTNWLLSFALFVLAILSKPMAVTFPLVMLILDWLVLQRVATPPAGTRSEPLRFVHTNAALVGEKLPFFLVAAFSSIVTLIAQQGGVQTTSDLGLWLKLANPVVSYATYLQDTVYPVGLSAFYPLRPIDFTTQFLPSLILVCMVSTACVISRAHRPLYLAGLLWFAVTLLPVIGIVQVGGQSHADRYMYIPSAGLLLIAGALVAAIPDRFRQLGNYSLCIALVFYAFMGWVQVRYWERPDMMFLRNLELEGDSYQAHVGLATYYREQGNLDQAEEHALAIIRLQPRLTVGHLSLGVVMLDAGRFEEAEKAYSVAYEINPTEIPTLNNLGIVKERLGKLEEARRLYREAQKLDPYNRKVRENLKRIEWLLRQ